MGMGAVAKPVVELIASNGALELAQLPMTDLGNAERFQRRFGDQFRYTTAKGWLGWDGRRWCVLDQEDKVTPAAVQEAVFATVRAIQDESAALAETGLFNEETNPTGLDKWVYPPKDGELLSTKLRKYGRTSEAAGKMACIPNLAKRWLTVPIELFDTDPDVVNCLSGTVRFVKTDGVWTAELRPHDRGDLLTRLAPVEFAPDVAVMAPVYDAMMIWAQPDADMRDYLHRWGGYSATGHIGEQKLQFWYGKGANGKSTVIDAWAHALGDYAGSIGIETFLDQGIKKRGEQASPDLARLGGVRMLRASEPERGARLNEALIKAATGGEPMAVRALHKGFFELKPQFKLTIGGNYRPDIPGTDEGIWRRVKLVPWDSYREEHERDDDLPNKLKAEAAGIFARMISGAVRWYNDGLAEPEKVKAATQQYRDESDPLARFLRLCTAMSIDGRIQSSRLYDVFCAWCKAAGEKEWSTKGFAKAMQDKGFHKKASDGMQWLGLTLTREVGDFIDGEGRVRTLADDMAAEPPSAANAHAPPSGGEQKDGLPSGQNDLGPDDWRAGLGSDDDDPF
jgi:P4 family phage/plasmid primase-like protien